jgi:hypothetical protein
VRNRAAAARHVACNRDELEVPMRTHPIRTDVARDYALDNTARVTQALATAAARSETRFFDSELHMIPGIVLPLRSMLVDSPGARMLISPIGTGDEHDAVAEGRLDALVAPSLLHGRHIKQAEDRDHPVTVWGPPGYAAKHPELGEINTLGDSGWPFGDVLDFEIIRGAPKRQEVVFFHPASRTIYTADLVFNIGTPHGVLAPLAYRAMGVYRQLGMMRMWLHWIDDRAAFRRSIDRILAWDFDRIAVAHGSIVETDGHARLEQALRERGLL